MLSYLLLNFGYELGGECIENSFTFFCQTLPTCRRIMGYSIDIISSASIDIPYCTTSTSIVIGLSGTLETNSGNASKLFLTTIVFLQTFSCPNLNTNP
jgi:hypothetical protein